MPIPDSAMQYVPYKDIFRRLARISPEWLILNRLPFLAKRIYEFRVYETLIEYPFVHANLLQEKGAKILDVGCGSSRLPLALASRGYKTWGIDLKPRYRYPVNHQNFTFVRGDIISSPFTDNFFDAVIAISSIEHMGLGSSQNIDTDGDSKALKEVFRILRPGGQGIITVPFGKKAISYQKEVPLYRAYDLPSLEAILSEFKINKMEFGLRKSLSCWVPASLEEVQNIDSRGIVTTYDVKAVAMVVFTKYM